MRRIYKILYFISLILTIFISWYKHSMNNTNSYDVFTIIGLFTSILAIIYVLKNNTKRPSKKEFIFEIIYIIYLILMSVLAYIYNMNAVYENIIYTYYYKLILIPFIGLNLYTVLLFKKEKE